MRRRRARGRTGHQFVRQLVIAFAFFLFFFVFFFYFWQPLHRVAVFISPFWWRWEEKASIVLASPQARCRSAAHWVNEEPEAGWLNVRLRRRSLMRGLCLALAPPPLRPPFTAPPPTLGVFIPLSPVSPLSQMYVPSGLAPHLWVSCLQSPRTAALSLCAADSFAHSGTCRGLNDFSPCNTGPRFDCVRWSMCKLGDVVFAVGGEVGGFYLRAPERLNREWRKLWCNTTMQLLQCPKRVNKQTDKKNATTCALHASGKNLTPSAGSSAGAAVVW